MISTPLFLVISAWLPQQGPAPLGLGGDTTKGIETVDELVIRESEAITAAVLEFALSEDSGLKLYVSEDGRSQIYSDFSKSESKKAFKRIDAMLGKVNLALGVPNDLAGLAEGEKARPLVGFMIHNQEIYNQLCDTIGEAGPSQADFMETSKNTTGFTIFAPEVTAYFHDLSVQEEARPDHSIGHNLVHFDLHRRYGILPLWIRESMATAVEDMAVGEVFAPWHLNGFVFTSSHAEWRGRETKKGVERATNLHSLFTYPANPYRDDLAHLGFAFATYTMLEEPEGLHAFLSAMEKEDAANYDRGGRSEFSAEMTQGFFDASFEPGFMDRFQKWWEKPLKWNKKPMKKNSSEARPE
ncbi:MAG: hypothetical protein O3A50_09290 [Planctomycetota bacterium]|nr:hypothetical protein [Planctomycetota bacterium]